MKNKLVIDQVKELIRAPYAFPGGYPKFLVMNDSECLCHNCAKENYSLIVRSTGFNYFDGWKAYCVEINWESEISCAHCGYLIESAYEVAE